MDEHERELKRLAEIQQAHFTNLGWLEKPSQKPSITKQVVNPTEQVMCPFCLYQDKLQSFFISTKKGISQAKAQCPECHNGMLMRTLLADMTPEQYAEWVWNYRSRGFWQKCKFSDWKVRLKNIGWAKRFWDKYKEIKGGFEVDKIIDSSGRTAKELDDLAEAYCANQHDDE